VDSSTWPSSCAGCRTRATCPHQMLLFKMDFTGAPSE